MTGTVLASRYELDQPLGENSLYAAFSARDRVLARDVCLRIVHPNLADPHDLVAKMEAVKAKFSSGIGPGIEPIFEVGDDSGQAFVVSELSAGVSLSERIRKLAPFSVPVSISTIQSLCESLEPLHAAGLAHGDLNPSNIVVQPDGQAKVQMSGMWEMCTVSPTAGALILPMMAPYLAPEVSAGGMPTPSSDVYACGVLLFELVSGRLPYQADTPVAMALKHANSGVPSVRMYVPSIPLVLDEIIKKAMSKDPVVRYADSNALLRDLRVLQDALRFGKALTWPLQPESPTRNSTSVAEPETQPIAPKMNAVRTPKAPKGEKVKLKSDVPVWLLMLMAFFGAIVLSLLATWIWSFGGKARIVRVPKVVGMKLPDAGKALEAAGLRSKLVGVTNSRDLAPDTVTDQTPGPNERVREGTMIALKKAAGPDTVSVPRVIGMTVENARAFLKQSDLELDDVIEKLNVPGKQEGEIVAQTPEPYTMSAKRTKIRVKVQSGEGVPTNRIDRDASIAARYRMKVRLQGLTRNVQVRIVLVDALGSRDLKNETGRPNQEFDVTAVGYGKEVLFQVYYDNQKVFEQKQSAPKPSQSEPDPTADPSPTPTDEPIPTESPVPETDPEVPTE